MATTASAGTAKRPLFAHPWRIAIVVAVVLVVINLVVIYVLDGADTQREGRGFPTGVESVNPRPGEIIRPQDGISADLDNTFTGVLQINGIEVPEDQTQRTVNLGILEFRPGPDQDVTVFTPGDYTATVLFWPQGKDRPVNPSAYSWSFRVGA
jgi:hypothetical protein